MDIRELDKKQLVLLTLLITFVVSIATGIVTVSLMNQMPKSVPQTINNVIQRTIEKVTTVPAPTPAIDKTDSSSNSSKNDAISLTGNSDALVSIYLKSSATTTAGENDNANIDTTTTDTTTDNTSGETAIGQGVIVSDIGLILVDSNLVKDGESYKVVLNKIYFDASILKKFDNGFTILKISPVVKDTTPATTDTTNNAQ